MRLGKLQLYLRQYVLGLAAMKVYCFSLLSFCIMACKQVEKPVAGLKLPNLTLVPAGTDTLFLDSIRTTEGMEFHFYSEDKVDFLFLNRSFSFTYIDIYNFSEKRFFKRIQLAKEGPDGLGMPPSGLFVKTLDSIYLFFNLGQRLICIDKNGRILEKIGSLRTGYDQLKYPFIEVSVFQPAVYYGNSIWFCTYQAECLHEYGGAFYNLDQKRLNYFSKLPDVYLHGWWAGVVYDRYYHTVNNEKNTYVWSYGNDHNIYTWSPSGKETYYAGSKYLPVRLNPYQKRAGDFAAEEQNLYRHAALQGGYSTIRYDKWQNVYYRFVILPNSPAAYRQPADTWARMGIIILDDSFNYRGEFIIPDKYSWYQFFIGPGGLYFLDKTYLYNTEDEAVFRVFRVRPVQHDAKDSTR